MKYRVNKQKCIGCRACLRNCPGATRIGADGKAQIIDQEKLEKCGGEGVCPMGAIEKISSSPETQSSAQPLTRPSTQSEFPSNGRGRGLGRGLGRGFGRGLGRGNNKGRGRGLGRGRRGRFQ